MLTAQRRQELEEELDSLRCQHEDLYRNTNEAFLNGGLDTQDKMMMISLQDSIIEIESILEADKTKRRQEVKEQIKKVFQLKEELKNTQYDSETVQFEADTWVDRLDKELERLCTLLMEIT